MPEQGIHAPGSQSEYRFRNGNPRVHRHMHRNMIMVKNLAVITLGAGAGASLRWFLSIMLNSIFPAIPLGTVAANFIGGFGIGLSLGVFNALPGLAPEWRLLVITGFLGGLTTFSTFTAEIGTLLQEQRLLMAMGAIALHVCGSLLFFFMGLGTVTLARSLFR
jgi:fluoride exporter